MTVTTKEKLFQILETLPDETTAEEAMERILFMAKVEKGMLQADEGDSLSHFEARKSLSKWLR